MEEIEKIKSKLETKEHIDAIQKILINLSCAIMERAMQHDKSKLEDPELQLFAEWGPKLKNMEYGSKEYKAALENMGPALQHHYKENRHHPEHWEHGVSGMNLVDLIEMVADWSASAKRVKNGSIMGSIEINRKRFDLSPQLVRIIINTADFINK